MPNKKTLKKSALLSLVGVFGLALLISTNPQSAPISLLIVPFILIFLVIFYIGQVIVNRYAVIHDAVGDKKTPVIIIVAGLPVLMLALQSLGQLTARDIVTFLSLATVLIFYVLKAPTVRSKD